MHKRALLVGINDYGSKQLNLRGCVNDVMKMKELLAGFYDFAAEDLRLLLNRDATKKNIVAGLKWLAQGGSATAVRVFHYAGHGYSVPDRSGDEEDGADEALVPHDFQQNGFLIDDALRKLYRLFPKNANLTLIMDCCHSGSIQRDPKKDIRYRFLPISDKQRKAIAAARRKFMRQQQAFVLAALADQRDLKITAGELEQRVHQAMRKFEKQHFGGDFKLREGNILLAACHSSQQAADAKFGRSYHGAFTFFLTEIVRARKGRITHRELVEKIGVALRDHDFPQIPQLECNPRREKAKLLAAF